MFQADFLDNGASLLELPERGDVHPDDRLRRVDGFGHALQQVFSPVPPAFRFPVPGRNERNGESVEGKTEII